MKAQVPYLARLARQGAGQPTLQPPRLLFTGANLPQPLVPASGERGMGPADAGPGGSRPGAAAGRRHGTVGAPDALLTASAPDAGQVPSASRIGSPAAIEAAARIDTSVAPTARGEPDPVRPTRPTRLAHDAEPAGQQATEPPAGGPSSAGPAAASAIRPALVPGPGEAARPTAVPYSGGVTRPASRPGPAAPPQQDITARPPESWTDPVWSRPVELPAGVPPVPSHEHAAGQLPAAAAAAAAAAADDLPLLPAHAPSPADARHVAAAPRSNGSRQAQLSIGTIEVTVVPAAKPPGADIPPAKPGIRSRPPSLIATGPGADRLRDGLRRWYGIAQG